MMVLRCTPSPMVFGSNKYRVLIIIRSSFGVPVIFVVHGEYTPSRVELEGAGTIRKPSQDGDLTMTVI